MIEEFKSIPIEKIAIDHTFHVTTLIKILDEEGSKRQFVALLLVLNEVGLVSRFMLCKSESLWELQRVLRDLGVSNTITEAFTDDCCKHRQILKHFFGEELIVYLDLFHAENRVTRNVGRKSLKKGRFGEFCKDLTYCFRQEMDRKVDKNGKDLGRTMATLHGC